jgi:protein subunit release factor A
LSGGGIEDDFAADGGGRRIKVDLASLQSESAMHRMQRCPEAEVRGSLGGIAVEYELLGLGQRCEHETKEQQLRVSG